MKDLVSLVALIAILSAVAFVGWAFKDVLFGIGYH